MIIGTLLFKMNRYHLTFKIIEKYFVSLVLKKKKKKKTRVLTTYFLVGKISPIYIYTRSEQ